MIHLRCELIFHIPYGSHSNQVLCQELRCSSVRDPVEKEGGLMGGPPCSVYSQMIHVLIIKQIVILPFYNEQGII